MGHDHKSGIFNSELIIEVGIWNRQQGNVGRIYDCDTAIRLKDGSYAESEGCWLSYLKASIEQQMSWHKKLQVMPNFIWELLREPSDLQKELNKLKDIWQVQDDFEYGVVIDAFTKKYHVADHQKEIITKDFSEILTIPCMDNLEIDLEKLYQIAYKGK